MHHYTYLLTFPDNMKYVGVHSTKIKPELDVCYLGSGRRLPTRTKDSCVKIILGIYSTREKAVKAETDFIRTNKCVISNDWFNCRDWNYDKHGQSKTSNKGVAASSHKLTGRTKETHKYIRDANTIRAGYSGTNRTPAQIEGQLRCAETVRGTTNPLKACKGIKNGGFEPWYYIQPCGLLTIVSDTPKQEYASKIGLTPRQLGHRFHYTNINKPAKGGVCKGWIFGNKKDLDTGTI